MAFVLILDDDRSIRELMHVFLSEEQHTPVLFTEGANALAYLSAQTIPHVVITDYLLPGMMGDEFLRRAQQECANVPHRYVLFTALPVSRISPHLRTSLKEQHISLLQKPFVLDELLSQLNIPLP